MRSSTLISTFALSATFSNAQSDSEQPILSLSDDESFHFDILGGLGQIIHGGGDINPILAAAKNIDAGNFTSFIQVFHALANETKAQAQDPDNAYDPVNVRETWFAAANYFRRADIYTHGNWDDPLVNSLWDEQLGAFNNALAALPIPGQRIQIPVDNFTIETIWYSSSTGGSTKRPTLILGNGYDAAQEDMYHTVVVPALTRGWNAITYEGPGQQTVRRNDNVGFIPDWERVVTPVVDWVLSEKASVVDTERLVLFGYSMGGYLAARAAAFEPRVKALVLDGGVWNVFDAYSAHFPPDLLELYEAGEKEGFDEATLAMVNDPNVTTVVRWGLQQGLWSFYAKSPFEWLDMTKEFALEDVIDRIQVPVWIADAEFEGFFAGQSQIVKDALGDKATLHVFKGPAGYHCQVGALQDLNRLMFAWLNKTLG